MIPCIAKPNFGSLLSKHFYFRMMIRVRVLVLVTASEAIAATVMMIASVTEMDRRPDANVIGSGARIVQKDLGTATEIRAIEIGETGREIAENGTGIAEIETGIMDGIDVTQEATNVNLRVALAKDRS